MFTQSYFIIKNTHKLNVLLDSSGYAKDKAIQLGCNMIAIDTPEMIAKSFWIKTLIPDYVIDCGTNVELFKSIAKYNKCFYSCKTVTRDSSIKWALHNSVDINNVYIQDSIVKKLIINFNKTL